jgi:hypothetical protein
MQCFVERTFMTTSALPTLMSLPLPDIGARWSGGGDELRPLGAGKFVRRAGLYIGAEVDEGLSCALDQAGVPRYEVNHRGTGTIDEVHYLGESFTCYPLIAGVAATRMAGLSPERKQALAQGGVGNRWKQDPRTGRNSGQVAFMAYLQPAWDNGYGGLIRLQFSGYQSDAALGALLRHCKNVQALGRLWNRPLSPVEVALRLEAGKPRTVGQGEKSTQITPIKAVELDLEHAAELECPDDLREQAAADWPSVVAWAQEYSGPIQQERPPEPESEPEAPEPAASSTEDDLFLEALQ